MVNLFGRKKPSNAATSDPASGNHLTSSPERPLPPTPEKQREREQKERKKSASKAVKAREKNSRPKSPRSSKSFHRSSKPDTDLHPLNLPPDELRRLSASPRYSHGEYGASNMAEVDMDREESAPPESSSPVTDTPGAFPTTNGVNGQHGEHSKPEFGPAPPPHKTPPSPPPPPEAEVPKVDPEACKAAGNKYYKARQYERAIQEYTKAIEADSKTSTYLSNRAAAYMANNDFAAALEDCKLADDFEPDNAKILHRLAKVYISLGRPGEALEVYDRIQPPAPAKDRAPAVSMQHHIQSAQSQLETGTSGSMVIHALDQAGRGLGYGVLPPRKWKLLRGEAYLKMGNVNSLGDAQNVAMSLLRSNNADPEALVLRGRAFYAQGDNDKAIQHFRQALACDPDFKDAVKYLRMVQKLDRMKEEGNAHFKFARYQAAVDIYTAALAVDPLNKGTNSKILQNRALCYSKLKQHKDALADADAALKLDGSYTKARKTRAKALLDLEQYQDAVNAYKAIADDHPDEPSIAKDVRHAETELKKSKRKDYYKILGVEKDCTDAEVKKAYRRLAVVHHPDKNPGDEGAHARFQDIQEAHETLSDGPKRERYDSGVDLVDPSEGMAGGFPGGFGMGGAGGMEIPPEVLAQLFSQGGGGGFSFGGGMPGGGRSRGGGGGAGGGFPQGFSPFG